MTTELVFLKDDDVLVQCIGGLILNFGSTEYITLLLIHEIKGIDAMRKARKATLSDKIKTINRILPESKFSESDKLKISDLLAEVVSHSALRNQMAHNPLCFVPKEKTGEVVLTSPDINKMDEQGVIKSPEIHYLQVRRAAVRIAAVNQGLNSILGFHPILELQQHV
jgi:hypothetical protein